MTLTTTLSSGSPPVSAPDSEDFDFDTECVTVVMGAGASAQTLTNGVDYDVPAGVPSDGCLFWISSTRKTGMGANSGGGNQQPSDFSVWLGAASDGINTIQLRRNNNSGSVTTRVTITIVSVLKSTSSSRFWVRDQGALSFGSGDTEGVGPSLPDSGTGTGDSVVDPSRIWVCVTGQQTDTTSRARAHRGKFTAEFDSGAAKLTRGHTGAAATASYAVVEFSSDWKAVQRLEFTSPSDGSGVWDSTGAPTYPNKDLNITQAIVADLGGTALSDISRAFLDPQFRNSTNGNQGNDDQGEVVELTGTNELTIRKSDNANLNASNKHHVVWVIEWDGLGGATPPVSRHYSHFVIQEEEGFGVEEGPIDRTVTEVGNLTNACVIGASSSCDGTGNGTPRGNVDVCLTSATVVRETRSETNRWERRAYSVFEWPLGVALNTVASRRSEIASAGSGGSGVSVAGSAVSELTQALSAASGSIAGQAGSGRSELGTAGSGASDIQGL